MNIDEIAETRAIAKVMLRKKARNNMINNSYNRYAFHDDMDNLPDWFLEDEKKHYFANLPITKEEVMAEKLALMEYNARPTKKVAEATARKKKRIARSMSKLKKKMGAVMNSSEIGEGSKLK